jgi:DNA-binding transcriptional ArsR family regulator
MTANDDYSGRLTRLEQQLQQISGRLAVLEHTHGQPVPAAPPASARWIADPEAEMPEFGEPTFSFSGQGRLGAEVIVIRQRARLSHVMEADPDLVAKVFAALASPARIIVLRALLNGPRSSQELRAELDDASVGQLYHHLRELLAAGLITQPARSQYAIPKGSLILICIQIIAAAQLSTGAPGIGTVEEDPSAGGVGP